MSSVSKFIMVRLLGEVVFLWVVMVMASMKMLMGVFFRWMFMASMKIIIMVRLLRGVVPGQHADEDGLVSLSLVSLGEGCVWLSGDSSIAHS